MTSNRNGRRCACMLVATLALGSVAARAADAATEEAAAPAPIVVPLMQAQAGAPVAALEVRGPDRDSLGFNPRERGVRNAAAQGPTTLRRYVQRTEAIYHFSYWDFARLLPKE